MLKRPEKKQLPTLLVLVTEMNLLAEEQALVAALNKNLRRREETVAGVLSEMGLSGAERQILRQLVSQYPTVTPSVKDIVQRVCWPGNVYAPAAHEVESRLPAGFDIEEELAAHAQDEATAGDVLRGV